MEIEIVKPLQETSNEIFPLEDFLKALEKVKRLAIKCAKEDENMKK